MTILPPNSANLPVYSVLEELGEALSCPKQTIPANAVLVAPPGAGKTTTVPLFLADQDWAVDKKIIMLEPRRIAARAASSFMAKNLGEKLGESVGLKVRFDNRSGPKTRVEVVTEGVFTRMILDNPELDGIAAVIFDEYHERSVDGDLGLALALDVQSALRPDLRLLVMSATLDGAGVAKLMNDAPIIESKGRSFPISYRYLPRNPNSGSKGRGNFGIEQDMANAILTAIASENGSILAFLPGQGEIHTTAQILEGKLDNNIALYKLYGAMDATSQDAVLRPAEKGTRKVILATAIAETSLTIEGITTVIDSGLARVARYDPASGVSRLETVKASRASIDQRAGRAGRTAPGTAIRLWHESNNIGLPASERPQILDADLRPIVLDLLSWGAISPEQLIFADFPSPAVWDLAVGQLIELGAIEQKTTLSLTALGKAMRKLPVAPHLAAMIVRSTEFGMQELAAKLAVLVSEVGLGGREVDLALRLERWENEVRSNKSNRAKRALSLARSIAKNVEPKASSEKHELSVGGLLSLGMADRIGMCRSSKSASSTPVNKFVDYGIANGKRASIEATEPIAQNQMIVVAEMQGQAQRPRIVSAASILEDEFQTLHGDEIAEERRITLETKTGQLRARSLRRFKKLVLASSTAKLQDDDRVEEAVVNAIEEEGLELLKLPSSIQQLLARLQFAHNNFNNDQDNHDNQDNQDNPDNSEFYWPSFDEETLASEARQWLLPFIPSIRSVKDITNTTLNYALLSRLPAQLGQKLDQLLPKTFTAPTGSKIAIRYQGDQAIVALRVQELYGLDTHPTLGQNKLPISFELLSPAHRPIQTTRDISGFWRGSWVDVCRDMKGRYPKHLWPEEPQTASPTTRTKHESKKGKQ